MRPILPIRLLYADVQLRQLHPADGPARRPGPRAVLRGGGGAQGQGHHHPMASDRVLLHLHVGGQDGHPLGSAPLVAPWSNGPVQWRL